MGKKLFIVTFFSLQVAGIIVSRFIPERFFCWAPYDEITQYELKVKVNGVELTEAQVLKRYRRSKTGRVNRSIANLKSIIAQYEENQSDSQMINVELCFFTNGHSIEYWYWSTGK